MTKVVVLGNTGMLGSKVYSYLNLQCFDVEGLSRKDYGNLAKKINREKLFSILGTLEPDYVVNCVGLIKPRCESRKDAISVNALFPHELKDFCDGIGAFLIHPSTDCVFDGNTEEPYTVDDEYTAHDVYGMTKALGEFDDENHLVLRTSIIGREVGGNKRSLVEWFLEQDECNGFVNHIWSGVTTDYFAEVVADIVAGNLVTSGLQVLASREPVDKYMLLTYLRERYNKDTKIKPYVAGTSVNRWMEPTIEAPHIRDMVKDMD